MQKRKIPVFYHIPKNAGTYISDYMLTAFQYYRKIYTNWLKNYNTEQDSIKIIQIIKNNLIIARLFLGDPTYKLDVNDVNIKFQKHNVRRWDVDISQFLLFPLTDLFLFGIVIEANGFQTRQEILNYFKEYDLYQFLILRDSFSRAQSMYNYNISNESIDDYCHGAIKSETFEEYIASYQLEDSWLIRNLVNVDKSEEVKEPHFQQALEILKSFNVYDIKDTDTAIQKIFEECYGFDTQKIELKPWDNITKNETKYKKINIEELSEKSQETFKQRTIWDQKLYEQLKKGNR